MKPDDENVVATDPSPSPPPPRIAPPRIVAGDSTGHTAPSLDIRPEQVEQTVRVFRENAQTLSELITDGSRKLQMSPMADDEVSAEAAAGFSKAGQVHIDAVTRYQQWLRAIADDLQRSASAYRATEDGNSGTLRGGDGG
ncbi:PE family protein [Kibdelosporangium phytohabitans]|nr:PE domain-containing protein [Kibdelosporangium phytohabitans]